MAKPVKRSVAGMVLAIVCSVCVLGVLTGCGTFGNGKLDPGGVELLDLTKVDVNVEWVSADGRAFHVVQTGEGIDVQGVFVEPKTGLVFELGEGIGALTVRDPTTGLQVSIKPKVQTE